jgi:hypothetical protein
LRSNSLRSMASMSTKSGSKGPPGPGEGLVIFGMLDPGGRGFLLNFRGARRGAISRVSLFHMG